MVSRFCSPSSTIMGQRQRIEKAPVGEPTGASLQTRLERYGVVFFADGFAPVPWSACGATFALGFAVSLLGAGAWDEAVFFLAFFAPGFAVSLLAAGA